jgi:tetratricopeptide (TPR) repeat protein
MMQGLMGTLLVASVAGAFGAADPMLSARDRQDRAALARIAAEAGTAADRQSNDAAAQHRAAVAASYLAEVSLEQRDKSAAQSAATGGMRYAEKAVALEPQNGGHYRVLGTLYGQVIPANVLMGLKYGKRAQEAIAKAVELSPGSAAAYLARGVGNYYLPAMFGGGPEVAIRDIRKAIEIDPKSADAYLWLGLALRKTNQNADARKAFEQSLRLNPNRLWAKQQLEKTPPQ